MPLGEPLTSFGSGYPLHHLRAALRLPYGGSATIPLAPHGFAVRVSAHCVRL